MNRLTDIVLGVWFLLVAAAFWGPYFGWGLPANILTALYAVFLLVVVVPLTLRLLRKKSE